MVLCHVILKVSVMWWEGVVFGDIRKLSLSNGIFFSLLYKQIKKSDLTLIEIRVKCEVSICFINIIIKSV